MSDRSAPTWNDFEGKAQGTGHCAAGHNTQLASHHHQYQPVEIKLKQILRSVHNYIGSFKNNT